MKALVTTSATLAAALVALLPVGFSRAATVAYEVTSPYHHIRVIDNSGLRTLFFDDAPESQMSLQEPLKGHFEYTEYFHLAWLWNARITNVLMIGLGGGSTQRSFAQYHPGVAIETFEIDPVVLQIARDYFHFQESNLQKVRIEDGRIALRRSAARWDLIILDAYIRERYDSSIPQHLATKEFFQLVRDHLNTNGAVAYNIIGTMNGWHAAIVGALFRTLKTVFPQVYVFQARESMNLVLLATRSPTRIDLATLRLRADFLVRTRGLAVPQFRERVESFQYQEPAAAFRSPILTDDYAPVEGLSAAADKP